MLILTRVINFQSRISLYIIEPEAGPPFTRYNSSLHNAVLQPSRKHKMNDLKATSVLQKLYKDSAREGQLSLVSTHDVTNPPVHYCNWSLVYFGSKVLTIFTNKL